MQQGAAVQPTRTSDVLQTYVGNDVASFMTADSTAGVYVLQLQTTDRDSTVRMYATTTPHSDHAYPELPTDPAVMVEHVSRYNIEVAWKPSPTDTVHGQDVEYCLAINTEHNFATHCAALGIIEGDTPPTAPPNAGFGFSWEREREEKDIATTTTSTEPDADPAETFHTCIGHKTSYSINNLRPDKKYFVDVFVAHNNRSTAYKGVSVQTKPNIKKISLKKGKVLTTFIKKNKGGKLFQYRLRRSRDEITVVVQPCFGELRVEVSLEGNILERRIVRNINKLVFKNATKGIYLIDISTQYRQSAYFKLVVSRRQSRIPYPTLPKDITIKVFDNKRTCRSLTVAWLGSEHKYQYCLYAKELKETDNPLNRILSSWNRCIDQSVRKKSEKIMCRNVRFKDKNRAVITEQIRGLKKNTKYIIDVYVSKTGGRGETLSYQSATVTTKKSC